MELQGQHHTSPLEPVTRLSTLRFAAYLIATNVRASANLRRSFALQMLFMLANNFFFFTFWWLFFRRFPSVKGWQLPDIALLYALCAGAYGMTVVFFGGIRLLSRMIDEGLLDGFLTQPKPVLLQALCARSSASGWGDLATAFILLGVTGQLFSLKIFAAIVLMLSGSVILIATGVLLCSLSFWWKHLEGLTRQIIEFVMTFATYPMHIFEPLLRLLLFTALPAAYIGYLPVRILREGSWQLWLGQLTATLVYGVLAMYIFHRGMRRYQSGNLIVTRVN